MNRTQAQEARIALITGASRGLGRSMAEQLAQRGVDVMLTYRSGERAAHEVAERLVALGRKASVLHLDVADTTSFEPFARAVATELQRTWGRDRAFAALSRPW